MTLWEQSSSMGQVSVYYTYNPLNFTTIVGADYKINVLIMLLQIKSLNLRFDDCVCPVPIGVNCRNFVCNHLATKVFLKANCWLRDKCR